ncbi:hypothetical protein [Nocardia sp. NPDC003726]
MATDHSPACTSRAEGKSSLPTNVFVLAGAPVGLAIWTRPLWWSPDLAERAAGVVVPVLFGLLLVLAGAAVLVGTCTQAFSRSARSLRYRRRWARATFEAGLTRTERGVRVVPRLASVTSERAGDVVRVQMLEHQVPRDWANQIGVLAPMFGAVAGRVRLVEGKPSQIDLVFRPAQAIKASVVLGGAA